MSSTPMYHFAKCTYIHIHVYHEDKWVCPWMALRHIPIWYCQARHMPVSPTHYGNFVPKPMPIQITNPLIEKLTDTCSVCPNNRVKTHQADVAISSPFSRPTVQPIGLCMMYETSRFFCQSLIILTFQNLQISCVPIINQTMFLV